MVHRVIDSVMDGIADGATGLVSGAANAVRSTGGAVMKGLDKPFTELTGKEGPHRIFDRAANGLLNAVVNAANQGFIGSIRTAGKGIMSALDHPLEQIGKGKMSLPKLFKK